jgi:hypothetical protein
MNYVQFQLYVKEGLLQLTGVGPKTKIAQNLLQRIYPVSYVI